MIPGSGMSNAKDTKVKSFFYRVWREMDTQDHNGKQVKKKEYDINKYK